MIAINRTDRSQLLTALGSRGFTVDTQHGAVPVDLMLPKDDHDQACLTRRHWHRLGELSIWIISPEDFVLHKLKAGRAQDFIDVLSVLQRQSTSVDRTYMTDWAKRLGIWEEWQYVQTQADSPTS